MSCTHLILSHELLRVFQYFWLQFIIVEIGNRIISIQSVEVLDERRFYFLFLCILALRRLFLTSLILLRFWIFYFSLFFLNLSTFLFELSTLFHFLLIILSSKSFDEIDNLQIGLTPIINKKLAYFMYSWIDDGWIFIAFIQIVWVRCVLRGFDSCVTIDDR